MTTKDMKLRSNKILSLFRVFSWDLVFFYSFNVLFLTQIKGFSEAEIMYTSTVIALIPILFQYPFNILAKKIGALNSVRLGCFCFFAFTIGILIYSNIVLLYLNYVIFAIGSIFLVPNISVLSIKNLKMEGKDSEFSKIEGRGAAIYYLINAIASIALGYLFEVNPYLTMSFSVIAGAVGLLLSFILRDEEKYTPRLSEDSQKEKPKKDILQTEKSQEDKSQKDTFQEEKPQEENISRQKKSKLLSVQTVYLLLLAFCFYGLIMIESNIKQLLFQDVGFSSVIIGWISFGVSIFKSASCEIYKCFKNKSKIIITLMPICYFLLLLILAICFIVIKQNLALQILVIVVCALFPFFNEPFKIGTKDYVRQTVQSQKQVDTFSLLFVVRNISQLLYSIFVGTLLTGMSISSSLLYIVALGGNIFALSQLSFFVYKKLKNKKDRIYLQ